MKSFSELIYLVRLLLAFSALYIQRAACFLFAYCTLCCIPPASSTSNPPGYFLQLIFRSSPFATISWDANFVQEWHFQFLPLDGAYKLTLSFVLPGYPRPSRPPLTSHWERPGPCLFYSILFLFYFQALSRQESIFKQQQQQQQNTLLTNARVLHRSNSPAPAPHFPHQMDCPPPGPSRPLSGVLLSCSPVGHRASSPECQRMKRLRFRARTAYTA